MRISLSVSLVFVTSLSWAESPVRVDGTSHMTEISRALIAAAEDANYLLTLENEESGSGGGFKRFSEGVADINKSARPIKDNERKACKDRGVEFVAVVVGHSIDQSETLRLFINTKSLRRESVRNFLGYFLSENAQALIGIHGKRLSEEELNDSRETIRDAIASAIQTPATRTISDVPLVPASSIDNPTSAAGSQ